MSRRDDSPDEPFRPAHPLPPACEGCPAHRHALAFVPPSGPPSSPLLLLGQGPGRDEGASGRPFTGRSGQRLTRWCVSSKTLEWKARARIANVVYCVLPKNRPPTTEEVSHCRRTHWDTELLGRRVILLLGIPAMKAVIDPHATVSETGQWVELPNGSYAMGLVHPAAILQGLWGYDPYQTMHLKRVKEVLDGATPYIPDWSLPPPKSNLWPTLSELQEWETRIGPNGVTIDVEAAGNVLTHVGLRANDSLEGVQVGFRTMGGELWLHCPVCGGPSEGNPRSVGCEHRLDAFRDVVWWLAKLLASPSIPKTFQNGQAYDIPEQLENVGFIVRGYCWDTLLMIHLRLPEAPKALEQLASALLGLSGWKRLANAEDAGDLK